MQNSELCNNVGSKKRQKSEEESKNRFFFITCSIFWNVELFGGIGPFAVSELTSETGTDCSIIEHWHHNWNKE